MKTYKIIFSRIFVSLALSLLLIGCSSRSIFDLKMMNAPDVFDDEIVNLLGEPDYIDSIPYEGILYMTNRLPALKDEKNRFYHNVRSGRIRVGIGQVTYSGKKSRSGKLNEITMLETRSNKYQLRVNNIEEYGILFDVEPFGFLHDPSELDGEKRADQSFSDLINKKLSASKQKEIFLYVHGYKTVFENPILVSAEFWHFMNYDGVFVSYSWPATPRRFAYFKDIETAHFSGHNLRHVIEYLAKHTNTEKIHIIGYSAGTRVVLTALHELALIRHGNSKQEIQDELHLGQIILVGSDYDKERFAAAVSDGLLKVPDIVTVYISETDDALGISRFLFQEARLGQMVRSETVSPAVESWLKRSEEIYFINVTDAEKSNTGNGHAYFRDSPWVSSDILMTLKYGFTPAERGLELEESGIILSFPTDYISRLRNAVIKAHPNY